MVVVNFEGFFPRPRAQGTPAQGTPAQGTPHKVPCTRYMYPPPHCPLELEAGSQNNTVGGRGVLPSPRRPGAQRAPGGPGPHKVRTRSAQGQGGQSWPGPGSRRPGTRFPRRSPAQGPPHKVPRTRFLLPPAHKVFAPPRAQGFRAPPRAQGCTRSF